MNKKIIQEFQKIISPDRILENEPMYLHTTFRIGGPADLFLQPSSPEEIGRITEFCRQEGLPFTIVGRGSDLLVGDLGVRGVVIEIGDRMNAVRISGERLTAQAGARLASIGRAAMAASLSGVEFASGIPGTLGGAVFMNAGAYGGEMKDVIVNVRVLDPEGRYLTIPAADMKMGYRTSIVREKGYIVLEAELLLRRGQKEEIAARMKDLAERRSSKQPLTMPSAGSTFKRPEGYFAGKLIMDSGLRGFRVGGAQVSEKHCGFVVNCGNATARDVRELIARVQDTVEEKFGVRLEPEVQFLGEFV